MSGSTQEETLTEYERAALDALTLYALRTREYNALIDTPDLDYSSPAYVAAANAMEAANDAALAAAERLLASQ